MEKLTHSLSGLWLRLTGNRPAPRPSERDAAAAPRTGRLHLVPEDANRTPNRATLFPDPFEAFPEPQAARATSRGFHSLDEYPRHRRRTDPTPKGARTISLVRPSIQRPTSF